MAQCNSLMEALSENGKDACPDKNKEQLKEDLDRLQQLMINYISIISGVSTLIDEYANLQRLMRIRVRKMQIQKKTVLNK